MIGNKDGYALVTGASSGIGYELAKLFAKDGKNIIVVARSQDKLEDLKTEVESKYGTNVMVLVKDLADPNAPQEIVAELEKENINVDVLVNNAGFAVYGKFAETDWGKESEMIQVNITSLTDLTKLFLKRMLENGSGRIMNVASGIAFVPGPLFSIYAASKAYVLHFSEALANEVKGTGVNVFCFCPAATGSLFWERADAEHCRAGKSRLMDSAKAARIGYTALKKGKVTAIAGLDNKLMIFSTRFAPRGVLPKMVRWFFEPA
jgi:short-subunit dehydrogenase